MHGEQVDVLTRVAGFAVKVELSALWTHQTKASSPLANSVNLHGCKKLEEWAGVRLIS